MSAFAHAFTDKERPPLSNRCRHCLFRDNEHDPTDDRCPEDEIQALCNALELETDEQLVAS